MPIQIPFSKRIHLKRICRSGGLARVKLYGNPGTLEGRRLGGTRSLEVHRGSNSRFRNLRKIKTPTHSANLAEFLGVLMGDGHLSKYQVSITTHKITDKEHAIYVQGLARQLFGLPTALFERKNKNAVVIQISSKNLVQKLNLLGMPIGNKIQQNLSVPQWIFQKDEYKKAFLRGVFDTDGSVYQETHQIKTKKYCYMGWTITSYADTFISGLKQLLQELEFSPTNKPSQKSIFLRRQGEVIRFFEVVGTSNPKHQSRFNRFKKGRVPKWS